MKTMIYTTRTVGSEVIESINSKASLSTFPDIPALRNNVNNQYIPETSPVADNSDRFEYDREPERINKSPTNERNANKRKRKKDNIDETV